MGKQFTALLLSVLLSFACMPVSFATEDADIEQNDAQGAEGSVILQPAGDGISDTTWQDDIEQWGIQNVREFLDDYGRAIVEDVQHLIESNGSVSQEECIDLALELLKAWLIDKAAAIDPALAEHGWSIDIVAILIDTPIQDLNAANVIDTLLTSLIKDWIKETIGVEIPLPEYYAGDIAFVNQLIRTYDLPADVASTDGGGVRMWIMSGFAEFDDSWPKRLKGIRIVVQNSNSAPMDFSEAKNLAWIFINGGSCSEISVKELKNLTALEIKHTGNLKKINAGGCVSLESLTCNTSQLEQLIVSHTPKLEKLVILQQNLSSLKLDGCPNLKELTCTNGPLTTINVDALRHLIAFDCSGNQLKTLSVAECGELETLNAEKNQLESVTMGSALRSLQTVNLSTNRFTSFSLDGGRLLEKLYLDGNPLEQLAVTNSVRLTTLQHGNTNRITSVDIHGCSALKRLEGSLKGEFTYLNIENCVSLDQSLGFQLSRRDGMSSAAKVVNVNGCTLQASCEDHNGMQMLYTVTLVPTKGTVVLNGNTLNPPNVALNPSLPLGDTTNWYNKAKEFLLNRDCKLVMWYGNRPASADASAAPYPSATVRPTSSAIPSINPTTSNRPSPAIPSGEIRPTPKPAPSIPALAGCQCGIINSRTYYIKTSGCSTLYYLRSSSGRMVRVSAPYAASTYGFRYYPVNYGGKVLFPRLENGQITCFCEFKDGMEVPVLTIPADARLQTDSNRYQIGTINGKTYYVRTSGASTMFYLRSSSGRMARVAAPAVTAADGIHFYPVNCGGVILFPRLKDGTLTSYVTGSGDKVLQIV